MKRPVGNSRQGWICHLACSLAIWFACAATAWGQAQPWTQAKTMGIFRVDSSGYGSWWIDVNRNHVWDTADSNYGVKSFGLGGDIPVVGDWLGTGHMQMGVFRFGAWWLDMNDNQTWDGGDQVFSWGFGTDIPVVGDWDHTGKLRIGVYRVGSDGLGYWYVNLHTCADSYGCSWGGRDGNQPETPGVDYQVFQWGRQGDIPVVGDWNHTGHLRIGVFRPSTNQWLVNLNDCNDYSCGNLVAYNFSPFPGTGKPVVGDWNSSGVLGIGVFNAGAWIADVDGNNTWDGAEPSYSFGLQGDLPVMGPWYVPSSPPVLSITSTHSGTFIANGGAGAEFDLTVSNAAGTSTTSGTVTVILSLSSGMTISSTYATGWTCNGGILGFVNASCSRSDSLAAGSSYPVIPVIVTIAPGTTGQVNLSATVTGGGSPNATETDYATIGTTTTYYTIGGTITSNNTGLSGVTVALTGSASNSVTTNASGGYSFSVASGGSYTITPSLAGYTFSPASYTYNALAMGQTAPFTATQTSTYVISGQVQQPTGAGVPLASLTVTGSTTTTVTADASGYYSVSLPPGNYTLQPSATYGQSNPISKAYVNLAANQTAQNYRVRPFNAAENPTPDGNGSLQTYTIPDDGQLRTYTFTWTTAGVTANQMKDPPGCWIGPASGPPTPGMTSTLVTPLSSGKDFQLKISAALGTTDALQYLFCSNGAGNTTVPCDCSIRVVKTSLDFSIINLDNPYNTIPDYNANTTTPVVYGGSVSSTSDKLTVYMNGALSTNTAYATGAISQTWTLSGPGSSAYTTPGPTAVTWNLGSIHPQPGLLTFTVVVQFSNGPPVTVTRSIEVGIRTDDVIVIGWIDQNGVPLDGTNVTSSTLEILPVDGQVTGSLTCNQFILSLSYGNTHPLLIPLQASDRTYILNWMFRYAPNPNPRDVIPNGDFLDAAGIAADELKIATYSAIPTNYKLFNRFQVKIRYVLDPATGSPQINSATGFPTFNGAPIQLHAPTPAIGTTKNPCGTVLGFLALFGGQTGPLNGVAVSTNNDRVGMINDGSPDSGAIRAFNTLTGKDVPSPVFWENIGSQIRFSTQFGTSAIRIVQAYPTYHIFVNGKYTDLNAQAAQPFDHFVANPYPFGTVYCLDPAYYLTYGITPGGRCGDAQSPPDPTARQPDFTKI